VSAWTVKETRNGIQFKIKVQPRASRNEISGMQCDELKVKLMAPPVDGEANEACIRFLADVFKVSRKSVRITSGLTSQHKVIEIVGISQDEVMKTLDGYLLG
jgi:uncharacterized protein (TIGR00251 family)